MSLYWIWLTGRPGLGPVKLRRLLARFGSPKALYDADAAQLTREGVSEAECRALLDRDLGPARRVLDACEKADVWLLTVADAAWPATLRTAENAPLLLYGRGRLPAPGLQPWLGLVGAREADARGLSLARLLGWQIAGCGGVVVTGMAKGVDAEAAWGALDRGGSVVGVLGCGADVVYPKQNAALFARVTEQGCLLSEYPPGVKPDARHFPARNRIISALSDGVAVIQATEQSGALITARWAAEQGRDVFAVPGPAGEPLSRGCNRLLREGALLAESGWDIMREYRGSYPGAVRACSEIPPPRAAAQAQPAAGKPQAARPEEPASEPRRSVPRSEDLTPVQQQIAEALRDGPLQLDALIDRLGLPAAQVLPQLTLLQIQRIITQKPGKLYELSGG